MTRRYNNAIGIQEGACNPTAIAHSIIQACQEINCENGGTDTIRQDPAVRLMVHQLAFLTNQTEIDNSMPCYSNLIKQCKDKQ